MPGVDPEVAIHRLHVDSMFVPIKQRKRTFSDEKNMAIGIEVEALLKARPIRELQFPEWIVNVVLGDWWTVVQGMKSLISWMYQGDITRYVCSQRTRRKRPFFTEYDMFCWKVMPFGLKNAGAYQRMVKEIFANQIRRNMEIYVDDMLVKSKETAYHLENLRETFEQLRGSKLRINPEKCSFGVILGKFLGYMISERGIESNPDKISALLDMKQTKSYKDVQTFDRLPGSLKSLHLQVRRAESSILQELETCVEGELSLG
ncbi:hypothetical protein LIER_22990 [Lithospermum erythrorhizon]|uniref:Reverse transcriptase domain-containing protein n=1 Tax=Lithospermum erythrorhizon TaxID=34254 RepID=A0AAV3QXD3_LITER